MITVVTPFSRIENKDLLLKVLEGKCNWIVLVDKDIEFPDWVTVKKYQKPPQDWCASNWLFNQFIEEGLDDETQYMILCDDDSVEEGFFDKIPNEDVVVVSMKRGNHIIPNPNCNYPTETLIASPDNMSIGKVAGEQLIIKGKILRYYRYGPSLVGDGQMAEMIAKDEKITYVPDAYVYFNYFEDGRWDSFRRKPIVLFVGDYWCAASPHMGTSEWEGNMWASLESTGLVNIARFHFDKYYYHTGRTGDEAVLEAIKDIRPDYIVLIIYKTPDSSINTPKLSTIMEMSSTRLITIWGDLEAEEQLTLARSIEPMCWKVVGTANKSVCERFGYTYLHVPKDPRVFNNPNKERDIDMVFSGSYGYGREERQKYMLHLLNNGIKLVHGGSEGGDHFTVEEYANRYKRAKLALSFSVARGMNVVNARPFEAMSCGAMLLEQESLELAKLYIPYVDYVPWTDEEDLLTKTRYYLEHDNERIKIADAGCKKTQELYSAKTFWKNVLK